MSQRRCTRCKGELSTGYRCLMCGFDNSLIPVVSSNNTVTSYDEPREIPIKTTLLAPETISNKGTRFSDQVLRDICNQLNSTETEEMFEIDKSNKIVGRITSAKINPVDSSLIINAEIVKDEICTPNKQLEKKDTIIQEMYNEAIGQGLVRLLDMLDELRYQAHKNERHYSLWKRVKRWLKGGTK